MRVIRGHMCDFEEEEPELEKAEEQPITIRQVYTIITNRSKIK
ncbi:MAG: hypothetical protein WBZ36_17530 [Candidatus Nitrosopolaris sp.]